MRLTRAPTIFTPMSALPSLVGGLHGAHDVLVAGAAADVAGRAPRGSRTSVGRVLAAQEVVRWSARSPGCRSRTAGRGSPRTPAASGAARRRGPARPSTVVSSWPSACTASIRHERTGSPSTSTVQAPQTPCSQPTWVPVRPRSWRRKSASDVRTRRPCVRSGCRSRSRRSIGVASMVILRISASAARTAWSTARGSRWRTSWRRYLGGAVQVGGGFEARGELAGQLLDQGRAGWCPTKPSTTADGDHGLGRDARRPRCRPGAPSPSSPIATAAATPTWAKSPWRRATSTNAAPLRVGHGGTRISVSISSGPTAVVK